MRIGIIGTGVAGSVLAEMLVGAPGITIDLAGHLIDGTGTGAGVDNVAGAVPLETVELPERCVLLFGAEGPGLSTGALAGCDVVVGISQFGSTRSVNVGAAAAVVMHAWVRRHAFGQRPAAWEDPDRPDRPDRHGPA